jgi:hypothetical protein
VGIVITSSRHPLICLATHTISEPLLSFNTLLLLSKAYCELSGVCLPFIVSGQLKWTQDVAFRL